MPLSKSPTAWTSDVPAYTMPLKGSTESLADTLDDALRAANPQQPDDGKNEDGSSTRALRPLSSHRSLGNLVGPRRTSLVAVAKGTTTDEVGSQRSGAGQHSVYKKSGADAHSRSLDRMASQLDDALNRSEQNLFASTGHLAQAKLAALGGATYLHNEGDENDAGDHDGSAGGVTRRAHETLLASRSPRKTGGAHHRPVGGGTATTAAATVPSHHPFATHHGSAAAVPLAQLTPRQQRQETEKLTLPDIVPAARGARPDFALVGAAAVKAAQAAILKGEERRRRLEGAASSAGTGSAGDVSKVSGAAVRSSAQDEAGLTERAKSITSLTARLTDPSHFPASYKQRTEAQRERREKVARAQAASDAAVDRTGATKRKIDAGDDGDMRHGPSPRSSNEDVLSVGGAEVLSKKAEEVVRRLTDPKNYTGTQLRRSQPELSGGGDSPSPQHTSRSSLTLHDAKRPAGKPRIEFFNTFLKPGIMPPAAASLPKLNAAAHTM